MASLEELESALSTAIESVIRSHGVVPPSDESEDSCITDTELDFVIERIKGMNLIDGERMMAGHLVRLGIYVPRVRMRASIHRVDSF